MEQNCQAHNLKVVGSNPTPATNLFNKINTMLTTKIRCEKHALTN